MKPWQEVETEGEEDGFGREEGDDDDEEEEEGEEGDDVEGDDEEEDAVDGEEEEEEEEGPTPVFMKADSIPEDQGKETDIELAVYAIDGRALHSFTSQLNLSRLCH